MSRRFTRACVPLTFMLLGGAAAGEVCDENCDGLIVSTNTNVYDIFNEDSPHSCYARPVLMQGASGTDRLLLFAEARDGGCAIHEPTDIVMSVSDDQGVTWSEPAVVVPGRFREQRSATNPAPVRDLVGIGRAGRIYLPFTRGNSAIYVTYSDDDGATWVEPEARAGLVQALEWWVGLGQGVQLESGRLVVPAYGSIFPLYDAGMLSAAFALFTDDGTAWVSSAHAATTPPHRSRADAAGRPRRSRAPRAWITAVRLLVSFPYRSSLVSWATRPPWSQCPPMRSRRRSCS